MRRPQYIKTVNKSAIIANMMVEVGNEQAKGWRQACRRGKPVSWWNWPKSHKLIYLSLLLFESELNCMALLWIFTGAFR